MTAYARKESMGVEKVKRVHPGRRALVTEGEVTVCVPVHTVPV